MKVVCIDNWKTGDKYLPLTIGKVYETDGGPAAQYRVRCDDGGLGDYSIRRFISIENWRASRLKELGI